MPDQVEVTDLNWGGGVIGDYQIPVDYHSPRPTETGYLDSAAVQKKVNSYLKDNREALCKLYDIEDDKLDSFLESPDPTTARLAFKTAFEAKMKTKTQGDMSKTSEVPIAEFLEDPVLLEQYKAAVKEEVNSKNYKNAAFLNSMTHYEGETLETPVYVPSGGPSGSGKSFLKHPGMKEVIANLPKKRDDQGNVIMRGNDVVSVDNGIARSTLQTGKMLVQFAGAKGYKEITDFNEVTKASVKNQIKAAASLVGLNMYDPKTYTEVNADQTVLDFAKKHDGYHAKVKYDVVAFNVVATKEVVRNQGVKRSQFKEAYAENEIELNKRDMPAEFKRYGKIVGNLDQRFRKLKNKSFNEGKKKSDAAAKRFRKKGITVVEANTTNRILVMFDNHGQLKRVGREQADNKQAFITNESAFAAWLKTPQVGTMEADFRTFEKTIPMKLSVESDPVAKEVQAIREAYAALYNKNKASGIVLLPIKDFNEFLRLTKMQAPSRKLEREKLLTILQEATADNASKAVIESTHSKFLENNFDFVGLGSNQRTKKDKVQLREQSNGVLAKILSLKSNESLNEKPEAIMVHSDIRLSPNTISLLKANYNKELPPFNYSMAKALFEKPTSLDALAEHLKHIDKSILDSNGHVVTIQKKQVRVFNGDKPFEMQLNSFYARGMQHASALLMIAKLENPPLDIDPEVLRKCIVEYTHQMEGITGNTAKDFKKAEENTIGFIEAMSKILADARKGDEKTAFADLKKGTEMLSLIEPSEDAICTVTTEPSGASLQLSEKLKFSSVTSLDSVKKSAWYSQNTKKHGAWFESFMEKNHKKVLNRSPVCTTRDMPNPSNAWTERNIYLDNNQKVKHVETHTRVAISSPFDIKDKAARIDMAAHDMEMLLTKTQLQTLTRNYLHRWGGVLDKNDPVNIPILHQTLVAPTFFYGADRNMMEVKRKSNEKVQSYLKDSAIKQEGHTFNFQLGQVNNCINIWHPVIIPTNKDVENSNNLVDYTANMLIRVDSKIPKGVDRKSDIDNLKGVIAYLKNKKRSWLPQPFSNPAPTIEQQLKIMEVRKKLWDGTLVGPAVLSVESQKELCIMMQSAINLKKLNAESKVGYALRQVKNLVRIKEVPVLAPFVFLTLLPVYILRYVFNTARRLFTYFKDKAPAPFIEVFMPSRNQQTMKSVYERLITSELGMEMGGCKSAFDREGEVAVHKQAMLNDLHKNDGRLFDSTVSDKEYYDYLDRAVTPTEASGHQNRLVATVDRVGARKLHEARTHSYVSSSSDDKKKAHQAAKLRKVGSAKGKKKQALLEPYSEVFTNAAAVREREASVSLEDDQAVAMTANSLLQAPPAIINVVAPPPAVVARPVQAAPALQAAPLQPNSVAPQAVGSDPTVLFSVVQASPAVDLGVDMDEPLVQQPAVQPVQAQQQPVAPLVPNVPAESAALSLEQIKRELTAGGRPRHVNTDVLSNDRLRVSRTSNSRPKHPEPHYTVGIDAANNQAVCYRVPLGPDHKMDPEALKLACEDAVFLAKPGFVFDLSQSSPGTKAEVERVLRAAITASGKTNLQVILEPQTAQPRAALGPAR